MPTTGNTFIEENWDCLSHTPLPKPHQIRCLILSQALRCRGSCCCCSLPSFGVFEYGKLCICHWWYPPRNFTCVCASSKAWCFVLPKHLPWGQFFFNLYCPCLGLVGLLCCLLSYGIRICNVEIIVLWEMYLKKPWSISVSFGANHKLLWIIKVHW